MTDRQHPSHRRHGEGPTGAPAPTGASTSGAPTPPGAPLHGQQGAAGTGQPINTTGAPGGVPTNDPGEVERLTADLEAAKAQAAELLAALQRERAEFQNFRRRTTEEREREAGLAGDYLLKKVIAIADDFDRAIDAQPADLAGHSWIEGIAAIDRKLRGLLESEGVRAIDAVGRPFDPREHEAITSVPATGRPDGEVIAEIQRGYRIRDRVLRPALVAVAAGGDSGPATPPPIDTNRSN